MNIDPRTGHPKHRVTPEHKVGDIYARDGMVVVVGAIGDQEVERTITREEAMFRTRAVDEMLGRTKHASERRKLQQIIDRFMKAVATAEAQDQGKYTPFEMKEALASIDPRKPLFPSN